MNWTDVLTDEARKNSVLQTDTLVRKYKLSEPAVHNSLRRYESRGLVERISTKIYINHFNQQVSSRDLVNTLRPRSYISLESALVDQGVITQNPSVLTCVTPGYPPTVRGKSVIIVYRKISPGLYWGFEEKATRYNKYLIAEPEKALLDWIYLTRQEGLPTSLDEVNLQFLNPGKLRAYAERYPKTVNQTIKDLLPEKAFPSTELTERTAGKRR